MNTALAESVTHIPRIYESGDKSTACILEEIGYLEAPGAVVVEDVEAALEREPKLADMWLDRANDQRLSGGWGIDCVDGEYRVQSYADGKCLTLRNRSRACAEFVVRYLRFVAEVLARYG